jgi:hypothetical protein
LAADEVLGLVLGWVGKAPSDVFAARDVGQFKLPDLSATTVSSPVCRSLILTTQFGFLDFMSIGFQI